MTLNTIKKAVVSVIALGAVALTGCAGGPCEQACDKFNQCTLDKRDHDVECNAFCNDERAFENRAQVQNADTCATEFNAYIDCENGLSNEAICNADDTTCNDAADAYAACVQKFCDVQANQTDPACLQTEDDDGNPIFVPSFAGF